MSKTYEQLMHDLNELTGDCDPEYYAETVRSSLGSGMMLDTLLELQEDIVTNGTSEGRKYIEQVMLVKPGEALPKVYDKRVLESPLTRKQYEIKVMAITDIHWNEGEEGGVIVTVLTDGKTKALKRDE